MAYRLIAAATIAAAALALTACASSPAPKTSAEPLPSDVLALIEHVQTGPALFSEQRSDDGWMDRIDIDPTTCGTAHVSWARDSRDMLTAIRIDCEVVMTDETHAFENRRADFLVTPGGVITLASLLPTRAAHEWGPPLIQPLTAAELTGGVR